MNNAARRLMLGVLYTSVALLVAVPPLYLLMTAPTCPTEPCQISSRSYFTVDMASVWLVPFSIAAVLLVLLFKLKNRA
ncbi:MAG: hypothetical protein ACU0CQ_15340 [Sulfitobacter sp.]|jgi:hypothetical protein|uniref:hypothetical protein n=1 Tax=Sulfitobacter sp. TaxID=1903071 RepID=UPI000C10714C|nr:hypothetical protein [Roseobacter sp.]MBV50839.1 hypothetical protein [Roseobacter sp.]PHR07405.1 MAG: hypothetical protein COB29_08775 [Sulfitobacter sp.]